MYTFMQIVKTLTDENRLRILLGLRERELCVCQLAGILDLAPSTTSKHLQLLRQVGLIDGKRKGKWVYYSLTDVNKAPQIVAEALTWVIKSVQNDLRVLEDQARITELLQQADFFCNSEDNLADTYHSLTIHRLADMDLEDVSESSIGAK